MNILKCELLKIAYSLVLTYAPLVFFFPDVPSRWHLLVMAFPFPLLYVIHMYECRMPEIWFSWSTAVGQ